VQPRGPDRHLVSPRTLLFLARDGRWLLLEGGPGKWFAGRLNGLGGHVEPGEDVRSAALREAEEECGLAPEWLELAAVVHVDAEPPVLLCVFTGGLPPGDLRPTSEGRHVWVPVERLTDGSLPLVPDLHVLLPQILERGLADPPVCLAWQA
jgi:8-oxo-dGTP diphosphatase